MGYYINEVNGRRLPSTGKANFLINNTEGSKRIPEPKQWQEGLVCIVDNGSFEAAGYAYSPEEMEVFKYPDGRDKIWLIVPNAKEFANY